MTDLDSTEILSTDESLMENTSINNIKASLKIISGMDSMTFDINKETIIGRSSPSDFIIAASSLSKQHAKISINNGQYFLTDLGSSNKTFQNKTQLQANICYALHNGDEIKFGDVICSFTEENQSKNTMETKDNHNPSTQTITNSYDDQEAIQPVKIWNQSNDVTSSTDVTGKQNGMNDSPNKASSSFVPHSTSSGGTINENDDDGNMIIGSTSVPATVPLIIESKNDDKFEIDQPVEIDKEMKDSSSSTKESMITDENKTPVNEDQMDTDQTNESPSMVIDEKQSENTNDMEEEVVSTTDTKAMPVDELKTEVTPTTMEQETIITNVNKITSDEEKMTNEPSTTDIHEEEEEEEEPSSTADVEETEESTTITGRGVARRNVRRARGRRTAATRARVLSTRLHGGRRQLPNRSKPTTEVTDDNNTTLEETVTTETEESPKKSTRTSETKEKKSTVMPKQIPIQENTTSNVRVSARIKERASSGRTRQFPYTDDYVDLDAVEKQSKANTTNITSTIERKSTRERTSTSPTKRVSLRQQPIDASTNIKQKDNTNVYEDIDAVVETPKSVGRKRKSTTPISAVASKKSRPTTPQTVPTASTRRKQTSTTEQSPTVTKSNRRSTGGQQPITTADITPKRGRKSTKSLPSTEPTPEKSNPVTDRPVRIALSSHLNFDQTHIDTLRKLGFEIMDETSPVDALVVDRIRRTKKFFMCLARGAHILSPTWIETMIKENRYVSYDKYYLEDTNAETRYGFQLRESVRLAKQNPIFQNRKFFCTKDTSPPYDDLKDIIEAAGGKLIEKLNMSKAAKDIICIVGQIHKNEYEDLFRKGLSIVSEEFILSGISKQKLDFDAFSLFQNVTPIKNK